MNRLALLAVGLLALGGLGFAGGGPAAVYPRGVPFGAREVVLVPYATTVLRFSDGVRYVATGWPYVQVGVLEGSLVLLRPLVREGEGELWVMLQDGREYRLRMRVVEGVVARTYRF